MSFSTHRFADQSDDLGDKRLAVPGKAGDTIQIQCLGSGDAFGSGGRFHPCYHVKAEGLSLLLDCGPSAPIAMKQLGVDPYTLDAIIISHLHGDHFGGIPFLIRETQVLGERERPLVIAGPPGTRERIQTAMENFFPHSTDKNLPFSLEYREFSPPRSLQFGSATVAAFPTEHREGTCPHTLRVEWKGHAIGYSGDSGWTDALVAAARDTDLFICEAFTYDTPKDGHLS
jgi:ribonuclease BN (tRNA processing enzyme)